MAADGAKWSKDEISCSPSNFTPVSKEYIQSCCNLMAAQVSVTIRANRRLSSKSMASLKCFIYKHSIKKVKKP